MEDDRVAVRVAESGEVAHPRIRRFRDELDALRLVPSAPETRPTRGCRTPPCSARTADCFLRFPEAQGVVRRSTSPLVHLTRRHARTSRMPAKARAVSRVGIEMKSICSTFTMGDASNVLSGRGAGVERCRVP